MKTTLHIPWTVWGTPHRDEVSFKFHTLTDVLHVLCYLDVIGYEFIIKTSEDYESNAGR